MRKNIFIFLIIILFLAVFIFPSLGDYLKIHIKSIFYSPARKIYHSAQSVGNFFSMIGSIGSKNQENADLKAKNMELESKVAQNEELAYENEKLKTALNFIQNTPIGNLLTVKVIGHSPINLLNTLEISAGSQNGIKSGQATMFQGYLVGLISEVRDNSATVFLITNANSEIPVMLTKSRATGMLKSGLSGLEVEKIPLDADVTEGEEIVTSSIGNLLPENILIGKVGKIISKESEIFKKVSVITPVEFNKLDILFINQ